MIKHLILCEICCFMMLMWLQKIGNSFILITFFGKFIIFHLKMVIFVTCDPVSKKFLHRNWACWCRWRVVGIYVGVCVGVELKLKLLVLIRIIKANIYSYSIYVFEYSALLRKRNIFFVFCYFFQSSSLVKKEYLKPENGLFSITHISSPKSVTLARVTYRNTKTGLT